MRRLIRILLRVVLPIAVVAAVAIGVLMYYNAWQETQDKERAAVALRQMILEARANATLEEKEWYVTHAVDPATGTRMVRSAYVNSDDGLCYLNVQRRLDGARLTGLDCLEFQIFESGDIEVKFDDDATSDRMALTSYSDSDDVYIPSYQADGYLSYEKFIDRLRIGNTVAIKIPAADDVWMTFSLKGSAKALDRLGQEEANPDPTS